MEIAPPFNPPSAGRTVDTLGRVLRDLRISVTDRCNFRCRYCLPRDKVSSESFLPRSELLDYEEITQVVAVFTALGTKKLRITGGEPLLRKELPRLIARLSGFGVEIALTTNGVLLPTLAQQLREAGVNRITVSLDALDEQVFQSMCDAPGYSSLDVIRGIEAAQQAGFERIKINCVVRRGENEDQILPLVRRFSGENISVRFIEYMDVGTVNNWNAQAVVSKEEILNILRQDGELVRLPAENAADVAVRYAGKHGEIGVIASMTEPFCGNCSRARLSADGRLYGCLFAHEGFDIKGPLRQGASEAELWALVKGFWEARSDRYSEVRSEQMKNLSSQAKLGSASERATGRVHLPTLGERVEMSYIGG